MFVTIVHCHVKPEHAEAFAEASTANCAQSILEPGNVRFDLLRQADDPNRFVLYEWYVDEAAAKAHKDTPHYAAWRERTTDMFADTRYGVRYEGLFPATPGAPTQAASPAQPAR